MAGTIPGANPVLVSDTRSRTGPGPGAYGSAVTPRIEPLPADSPEMLAIAPLAAKGANGSNVMGTMLRNPNLYEVWRPLARYLNSDNCIPVRDRELLILRTAWLSGSEYEWGNHVLAGRRAGLSDEEIRDVKVGAGHERWSPSDATLLRVPDELHAANRLSDDTWEALADRYDDAALLELIILVGQYVMLGFVLNSVHVARENDVPGLDAPAAP